MISVHLYTNMTHRTILNSCRKYVRHICATHKIPNHHGLQHVKRVDNIASMAYSNFYLSKSQKINISLACLLHDIDDPKFFSKPTHYLPNATEFLQKATDHQWIKYSDVNDIITMISLVSYSKNKNTVNPEIESWMYIPRDADRIDAGGIEGIKRFTEMCKDLERPLISGPLPIDMDSLRAMLIDGPTSNESALTFYVTDWWNRRQCASKSNCLELMIKKEYTIVEKWMMNVVNWCRDNPGNEYNYDIAVSLITE